MRQNFGETISVWQDQHPLRTFSPLKSDVEADVCIIGAGIAGLTCAYTLSQSGKKVVLLEDGAVAGGQTVRTTGHLTDTLDDRYFNLEKYFGVEGSTLAAQAHRTAIEFIADLVKKHQIDCQFERLDAYLFVPPGEPLTVLEEELGAAQRARISGVEIVSRAPLEFDTGPCLRFPNQAQFSPLPYIDKLCDLIIDAGGLIFTSTHAAQLEKQGSEYRIETKQGPAVLAKHVIIATNSPVFSRVLPHLKQAPYRTYVIGGKIPRGSVVNALYYDTPDPYHYIRIFPSDEKHDLLIIGGEDHRTAEVPDIEAIYTRLEKWARDRFPELQKIIYRWSGQVIEPVDSLAFIGRVKKGSEIYMVTGDSGNGLTHGTLSGIILNDLIHKRKNRWEKLLDPHRKTLATAKDFAKENLNTVCQYRDWVTAGDHSHLPNNSGTIVRDGVKKCAVYRDNEGHLHRMSATCPHLGAVVRWNTSEHCWECPAHGSRFSATGEVIQGPANCNLSEAQES